MRMWQTIRASALSRHCHEKAYAALVLSGGYEEAGDLGRFRVEAGAVILHDRFEAHLNRFSACGAVVLNFSLPAERCFSPGVFQIADPEAIVRKAEINPREAADIMLCMLSSARAMTNYRVQNRHFADWPDELAAALIEDSSLRLSDWSAEKKLAPWKVSRGFAQVFGISPEAFRARSRTRRACRAIQTTEMPLAEIAANLGFADQAHMTRSVKDMTGMAPMAWRHCK
jgi:AraC-like DNA-binding protein